MIQLLYYDKRLLSLNIDEIFISFLYIIAISGVKKHNIWIQIPIWVKYIQKN